MSHFIININEYEIPGTAHVLLAIFDVLGDEVCTLVNHHQPAGAHLVTRDAKNQAGQSVPSGFYFMKIKCDHFSALRKCLYLK
jgi:flagellar hook assembly protein FlgD